MASGDPFYESWKAASTVVSEPVRRGLVVGHSLRYVTRQVPGSRVDDLWAKLQCVHTLDTRIEWVEDSIAQQYLLPYTKLFGTLSGVEQAAEALTTAAALSATRALTETDVSCAAVVAPPLQVVRLGAVAALYSTHCDCVPQLELGATRAIQVKEHIELLICVDCDWTVALKHVPAHLPVLCIVQRDVGIASLVAFLRARTLSSVNRPKRMLPQAE